MHEIHNRIEGNDQPQYQFSLATGLTTVNVFSSDVFLNPADILSGGNHIEKRLPGGLRVLDQNSSGKDGPTINLVINESPEPSLEMYNSQEFSLAGPFHRREFYLRLPYIAYNISEKARQEALSMSSLHAAAVATKDGRSLLILGDKGSGKTLMSLTFGLQCELGLVGNDLVLANNQSGRIFARAGNQIFDVRQAVLKYYLPELSDSLPHKEGNPYEEKVTLLPEEIGISIGEDTKGVAAVVRVNVHPYNDRTLIEQGARRIQEILRLRENFARYIRGVVTPLVLDGKTMGGNFPSMDSDDLVRNRDLAIEQLLDSNFIYAYGNNPRDIANKIADLAL